MKKAVAALFCAVCFPVLAQNVTLEECIDMADKNYPLIRKYELIERTNDIDLSEINKSWLPRIGLYAQGSLQNDVPQFPDKMRSMLAGTGIDMEGLRKDQYKVGVDINQAVWDGGKAKADREVARAGAGVKKAATDVEIYAVRQRVQDLFFAVLLTEAQIRQHELSSVLLHNNLDKLKAMLTNGVAMKSDVDAVEAECLAVSQNIVRLKGAAGSYRNMLEIFIGSSLENRTFVCPSDDIPSDMETDRPELRSFDAERKMIESRQRQIGVSTMPKIGLFAQAYYGYPGFDYFHSMMSRDWTFNVMAGVKVSWVIDAFYTRKSKLSGLSAACEDVVLSKDVFMFNNRLASVQQQAEIRTQQALMEDDAKIVALRTAVRQAAESRLENGVIDTSQLLEKITEESAALLNAEYHKIELAKAISQLKYTLNR